MVHIRTFRPCATCPELTSNHCSKKVKLGKGKQEVDMPENYESLNLMLLSYNFIFFLVSQKVIFNTDKSVSNQECKAVAHRKHIVPMRIGKI